MLVGFSFLPILFKSKQAASRTLDHIISFVEEKLHLNVNGEKIVVAHTKDVKFLGHGFYIYKGCGLFPLHTKGIATRTYYLTLPT